MNEENKLNNIEKKNEIKNNTIDKSKKEPKKIKLKIGDIVNIKSDVQGNYFKGKVVKINESDSIQKIASLINVKAIDFLYDAIFFESELEFRDGEYWEK